MRLGFPPPEVLIYFPSFSHRDLYILTFDRKLFSWGGAQVMYFCNLLKNENISIWECVRTVLTGGPVPYLLSHSTERAFLPFVDKNTKITSQRQLSSQKNPMIQIQSSKMKNTHNRFFSIWYKLNLSRWKILTIGLTLRWSAWKTRWTNSEASW